jgi:hypothetical protein
VDNLHEHGLVWTVICQGVANEGRSWVRELYRMKCVCGYLTVACQELFMICLEAQIRNLSKSLTKMKLPVFHLYPYLQTQVCVILSLIRIREYLSFRQCYWFWKQPEGKLTSKQRRISRDMNYRKGFVKSNLDVSKPWTVQFEVVSKRGTEQSGFVRHSAVSCSQ